MIFTETHIISKGDKFFKEADRVSFLSKNLYNCALYSVKQEFIKTSVEKMSGLTSHAVYKNYHVIRKEFQGQVDYIALPQKVANHTLRLLDKNWRSFFTAIKDWKKHPEKYLGMPGMPGYLHIEEGRYTVSYERGAISTKELKKGLVKLSGTKIFVPFINKAHKLVSARLTPTDNNEYKLEIVYEKIKTEEEKKYELEHEKFLRTNGIIAGIDPGVNNLMAITFGKENVRPILINGRPLKSINQYYNKKRAELQEKMKKAQPKKKVETTDEKKSWRHVERVGKSTSANIKNLTANRNHKVDGFMHKATTVAIAKCVENGVGTIVVGKNNNWKQECNMGNVGNQNFISIPFAKMIDMLTYKGNAVGIKVIQTEESYSSKCSFLDLEEMKHHDKYLGKRTSRGCFKSAEGIKINADVNGSYNIIRKVAPEIFMKGVEGFAVNPLDLIQIHK